MAMGVQKAGLQVKPGFAGQTPPAGEARFVGQMGLCWPNVPLLAKHDCRSNRVLQAKPGLQAKQDCGPNRALR